MTALTSENGVKPTHAPRVLRTPTGYLACSDPDEHLQFAVPGNTEAEATEIYLRRYAWWRGYEASDNDATETTEVVQHG